MVAARLMSRLSRRGGGTQVDGGRENMDIGGPIGHAVLQELRVEINRGIWGMRGEPRGGGMNNA